MVFSICFPFFLVFSEKYFKNLGIRSSAAAATAAKKAAYRKRWLSGKPSKVCFFLGGSENILLILSRRNRIETLRRS